MESQEISITVSEIMEYLFCPRFTYFMNCLNIPQYEERRHKVLIGREIHHEKKFINKEYIRKKIGCIEKNLDVYLYSNKHHIRGVIDEVLKLEDGTYAPLDYKFAEYKEKIFKTYRLQLILYGLMIREIFSREVKKGYIVFTRSKNLLKETYINEKDFSVATETINEVFSIIKDNKFPKKTHDRLKCIDCCYKNICV